MPANSPYPGESPEAFKRRQAAQRRGGGLFSDERIKREYGRPMPETLQFPTYPSAKGQYEQLNRESGSQWNPGSIQVPQDLRKLLVPPQWVMEKGRQIGEAGRRGYDLLAGAFQRLRGRR